MPEIPEPLQKEEFRFIKVKENSKRPFEKNWQNQANYKHNDPELQQHLENGGNYGVVGGYGNLVIIDCDQEKVENAVAAQLPDTLKIRTGGGGTHFYFISPDLEDPIRLKDTEAGDLGDVQSKGKQVVGPTSNHPSGETYRIEEKNPIAEVKAEEIRFALRKFMQTDKISPAEEQDALNREYTEQDIEIDITDVIELTGLEKRGNEWYGEHPVHGSSTGQNFWVNPLKNTWHCFRHDSGGGPISWIAVKEGIIGCGDAVPGSLRGKDYSEVIEIGREDYGLPDPVKEYEEQDEKTWESLITLFEDQNTDKKMARHKVAEFIQENHNFISFKDTKALWRFSNPIYKQDGNTFLDQKLHTKLGGYVTSHTIEEIKKEIKGRNYIEREEIQDNPRYIPVKNGLYDIENNELVEPNPDLFITNEIPVEYDEDADCPEIKKFISEIVEEENIPLLQEIAGYTLYRDYPIARAFMFLGEGKNGKSQFIRLLKIFLGEKNVATPSLHDLVNNQFSKAELHRKLANLHADLSARTMKHTGAFKMLTGQDYIHAQRKFQDPFSFQNYAKLIYSANERPGTEDTTDAFFRRWIVIEFPYKFTEDPDDGHKDKVEDIADKITTDEELSGFFNWAVEGLQRVLDQGQFTKTEATGDIKDEWLAETDPLRVFAEKCVLEDSDSFITKDDFYKVYKQFCEAKGASVQEKNMVGRRLPQIISSVEAFNPKVDGKQQRAWKNIKFDEEAITDITHITDFENLTRTREADEGNSANSKRLDEMRNSRYMDGQKDNSKTTDLSQRLLDYVEKHDEGEGVRETDLYSLGEDEKVEEVLNYLSDEGTIYYARSGVVKKL